ncbi:acyltransferase [Candidatus Harpocratesius sp.]
MFWNYKKIKHEGKVPLDYRSNFSDWKFPKVPTSEPTIYGWRVFGYDEKEQEKLKIGFGSDIAAFSVLYAHNGIVIEPFVQIGPHCSIISKSTIDNKSGCVVLRQNCRIGAYSTIMPGVTIGANSIIGAYSFVNKSIPSDVIAFGIPCKVIKKL